MGLFAEPLRRPDGSFYEAAELPCTDLPHLWDYDATRGEKREAQRICREECPPEIRAACTTRRLELKTDADGVWGGVIIRRTKHTEALPHDPDVVAMAEQLGVELPPPPPAPRED